MVRIRIATNLDECEILWRRTVPQETISDLWEVRSCFQRHFNRPTYFVVAEEHGEVVGLLPLSWVEETGSYAYFPGETWQGKTWLEQNRIIARDENVRRKLVAHVPSPYSLRYLLVDEPPGSSHIVDEVGYLFYPGAYNHDMETYFGQFSHKSAKRIRKEIAAIEQYGVEYRYNDIDDFEHLVHLNVSRFGEESYFFDGRFRESFRSLMHFLREQGWLRLTAVIIDGEPAAVDMGCVYNGTYTLLAGGTNGRFPGVAKLINLHHMQRACNEKIPQVDFLCGNFSWKTMFHLAPRPLYAISSVPMDAQPPVVIQPQSVAKSRSAVHVA